MRCADVEALNRIFELKPDMAGRSHGHRDELEENFEAQFVCAGDRPRDLSMLDNKQCRTDHGTFSGHFMTTAESQADRWPKR